MPIKTSYLEKLKTINSVATEINYSYSSGITSFSIVYNKNGKRITFSKQLSQRLGLTDAAYIAPIPDDGVILVAQKLPEDKALKANLKGDDKKISYNAGIAEYLVNAFKLDYSNCSSKAFTNITFEKEGDMEVAIIKLIEPVAKAQSADVEEKANENS